MSRKVEDPLRKQQGVYAYLASFSWPEWGEMVWGPLSQMRVAQPDITHEGGLQFLTGTKVIGMQDISNIPMDAIVVRRPV